MAEIADSLTPGSLGSTPLVGGRGAALAANLGNGRPVQRLGLREQLTNELRRLITSGSIPLGATLPSEAELGKTFGCSRSVVREALREIEQLGLAGRSENGRNLVVETLSLEKVSYAVHLYMETQQITFSELFECLELLDPLSAALAAERGDGRLVAELTELNSDALLTVETLVEVELRFHLRMAEASGNRLFVASWKPVMEALGAANRQVLPLMGSVAVRGTQKAHAAMIEAIAQGNVAAARAWSERHCGGFRHQLARLGKSADDPVRPLQVGIL